MPKQGFKNQWIAISQKGKFRDSEGVERDLNADFLEQVIANTKEGDAPAVVGHPKDNSPAFGWATALRLNGDVLEAQFADTDDEFEQMVEKGLFRKRSASFYLNPPSLRHIGFLGATAPAIKGLREIQFSDGESVTVEISFSEDTKIMKDEEVNQVADSLWEKIKKGFKPVEADQSLAKPTAQFSEEDKKSLIAEAVKLANEAATANFAEQLKTRDEQIKTLTESVNANSASGKRSEIVAFVEAIPATQGKHFLKRAGVVEFLESCAVADAADAEKAICFSEGEGDKKVEHKLSRLEWAKNLLEALPPMIAFGEKFGDIKATAEADVLVNADSLNEMRDAMGMKKTAGGEK